MNSRLRRHYMKKIYGGRSSLARLLDFILLRALVLTGLFLLILQLFRSLTGAILISSFLTLAISLALHSFRVKRIERCIKKDLQKLREKCLLEQLALMEPAAYAAYMARLFDGLENISWTDAGFCAEKGNARVFVFHNHPSAECDVGIMLGVLRENRGRALNIVSLSAFSQEAKNLCGNWEQPIILTDGKEVLALAKKADMLPDEKAAQQRAEKEMNDTVQTLSKIKDAALSRGKVRGYMICGIAALIWPFVTGFRFYYPIIAALCFLLAVLAHRKAQRSEEDSQSIGLS